jgi:DNA polymerase I
LSFLKAAAGESRIHPRWNFMTKTSRITASNPAVQNVSKVRCRPLMRPETGWVMMKADYKQVQMRILANLSNDPELVSAFRQGLDVHWLTVEMCGIQGATHKEKRDKAKAVNFGILFQMTADGLSRELNTDRKTAQEYIIAFWKKYAVAKKWLDDFVEELKENDPKERFVRSSLGRKRLFDGEFGLRERRRAKATLLQQEEADLLRMAVMRLYARFRDLGMKSRVVMTIHDAVYVEAPDEEAQAARNILKTEMEAAVEMPVVPLEVDIE